MLVAHPDDESIGAGAHWPGCRHCRSSMRPTARRPTCRMRAGTALRAEEPTPMRAGRNFTGRLRSPKRDHAELIEWA